jgi:hypothetical protein
MTRAIQLAVFLACLWLVCFGCAGASYQGVLGDEPLAKPTTLLVYDFAVSPEDLVGDALGPNFDAPPPNDESHAIARELSEALVAKLGAKGIQAIRADSSYAVPTDALLLQGQFVRIQQGSRVARMAIGFGAGQQQLRVQAQMYQWTGTELRRVEQAEAEAHGDRAPGMGVPMAAGAVVTGGVLMPLIVSGSMNVGQEVIGGLRPTVGRLADVIADNLVKLYRERGWL